MHDIAIDLVTALLVVLAAATFASMIWAAHQVDGHVHRPHHPHWPRKGS